MREAQSNVSAYHVCQSESKCPTSLPADYRYPAIYTWEGGKVRRDCRILLISQVGGAKRADSSHWAQARRSCLYAAKASKQKAHQSWFATQCVPLRLRLLKSQKK